LARALFDSQTASGEVFGDRSSRFCRIYEFLSRQPVKLSANKYLPITIALV